MSEPDEFSIEEIEAILHVKVVGILAHPARLQGVHLPPGERTRLGHMTLIVEGR